MMETIKVLIDNIDPDKGVLGNIIKTDHTVFALESIFPNNIINIEYHASGTLKYVRKLDKYVYPIIMHNLTYINFMFAIGDSDYDVIALLPKEVRQAYFKNKVTILIVILEPLGGTHTSIDIKTFIKMIENNPRYNNMLFLTLHYIDSPNFMFINILQDLMQDWGPLDGELTTYDKLENHANRRFCCFLMNHRESEERNWLIRFFIKNNLLTKAFISVTNWDGDELFFNNLDLISTLNKSAINIIPEGNFERKLDHFMSEKVYRCFTNRKPFIYLGQHQSLQYIRSLGYKTFSPIINEDYDQIENDKLRFIEVCRQIKILADKSLEEFKNDMRQLEDICEHNYKLFVSTQNAAIPKLVSRLTE